MVGEYRLNTDILNKESFSSFIIEKFRRQCKQRYAATEIAYIERYLDGEETLHPDIDFSVENLEIIQNLRRNI